MTFSSHPNSTISEFKYNWKNRYYLCNYKQSIISIKYCYGFNFERVSYVKYLCSRVINCRIFMIRSSLHICRAWFRFLLTLVAIAFRRIIQQYTKLLPACSSLVARMITIHITHCKKQVRVVERIVSVSIYRYCIQNIHKINISTLNSSYIELIIKSGRYIAFYCLNYIRMYYIVF